MIGVTLDIDFSPFSYGLGGLVGYHTYLSIIDFSHEGWDMKDVSSSNSDIKLIVSIDEYTLEDIGYKNYNVIKGQTNKELIFPSITIEKEYDIIRKNINQRFIVSTNNIVGM